MEIFLAIFPDASAGSKVLDKREKENIQCHIYLAKLLVGAFVHGDYWERCYVSWVSNNLSANLNPQGTRTMT